jgi:hypothetical protein
MSSLIYGVSSTKPPIPPVRRLLMLVFSIGVIFGSGIGYGFNQAVSTANQRESTVQVDRQNIGLAEYERIVLGMSLSEVQTILGRGTEINRSTTIATFVWTNSDGSGMTTVFEKGKLKSKEQSGLK